ncbi:MAG: hypothetical protein IKC65_02170, partial [Lentisphaeria bacterium]|nr:hypothetical protein [Lentisphaeria bacterium]
MADVKLYVSSSYSSGTEGWGTTHFSTVTDAVNAASATESTVITIAAGTYNEDITLDARSMAQKGNITFAAAEGEKVTLTGLVTIGYYEKRVGSQKWDADVAFEGITFDQAASEKHSIDIQQVNDFSMTGCTVFGDGEYGILGTNVDNGATISGCTFENAGIQSAGSFGTNMLIEDCEFNESRVNIQSGNSVTIKDCTFDCTVTDANVGDSFYCIRSNDNAINIEGTVFNIDADLSEAVSAQAKWGVLWQRNAGGTKWVAEDIEVNFTDAAMAQEELLFNKNATTNAANEAGRIYISNLTSTDNDVTELMAKSEGIVTVKSEDVTFVLDDGVVTGKIVDNQFCVSAEVASLTNGDTVVIGGCTYIVGETAFATINAAVNKAKETEGKVTIEIASGEYTENVSFGTRTFVEDGKTYVGGITFKAADGADVKINGYFQCNGVAGDLKDIVFDGFEITNSIRNGGYFAPIMFGDNYSGKTASGIVVSNCTLNSTAVGGTSSGVALTMGLGCDGVTISGNTINADCGVYGGDGNLIANTLITGNVMNGNEAVPSYGYWGVVYIYNSGSGNEISGNTISDSALYAVKINKGNGVVLTDNTIAGCGDVKFTDGSIISGTTVDGEALADSFEAYTGSEIFVYNGIAGEAGDTVIIDGKSYIVGTNVFADANSGAAAVIGKADKMVILKGAETTYNANQWFFLNTVGEEFESGKWSYDYVVDASKTCDLQVDGTFQAYQILMNNAETTVSTTGKFFATGESMRIMGGTLSVEGIREADAGVPDEIFTGSWGGGTRPGADTQIKAGYFQLNQGATASFNNTVFFVNAGWMNFTDAAAEFKNTYIYLGSGGSYAPIAVELVDGAEVSLTANTTLINDAEFTMNITVDATSTLTMDADSMISATTLTVADGGQFIIDPTGFTGFKKIVDLSGEASLEGKVDFINKAEDVTVIYGADGDISLTDADMSTLYVSTAYADLEYGTAIEGKEGVYFGINAFADFDSAVNALTDNDTTIALLSDATMTADANYKLNVISGDGNDHKLQIDSVIDVDAEFAKEINIDASLFMAYYNNHNIVINGDLKGGFYNYTGSLTFNNSKITNSYENSNIGGVVTINGDGKWTVDNPQADNLMFLNVGRSDWLGQGILNLNDTVVKAIAFSVDSNSANAKSQINAVNSTIVTVLNDGAFGNLTVGANGEVNLKDSDLIVVGTLTNNGTINVSGESTLDIASVNGGKLVWDETTGAHVVKLLDGAVISDSTVGGYVDVVGKVTFRGDNTFATIQDFEVDYILDNEAVNSSEMIVEAGASVTLNGGKLGIGYGDKITVNGTLEDAKAAFEAGTLTEDDFALDAQKGIYLQASRGGDVSTFDINDAYVRLGDQNNNFMNDKKTTNGTLNGTYNFKWNNAVVTAEATFNMLDSGDLDGQYNFALEDTVFKIGAVTEDTYGDAYRGSFNFADKDSTFTATNSKVISIGKESQQYNAGTLAFTESVLDFDAQFVNEGTAEFSGETAVLDATNIVNKGTIILTEGAALTADSLSSAWASFQYNTVGEKPEYVTVVAFNDDGKEIGRTTAYADNNYNNVAWIPGASYKFYTVDESGVEKDITNSVTFDSESISKASEANLTLENASVDVKSLHVAGTLDINDGSLTAGAVINEDTINVSGNSTLNISTLTGNAIKFTDGTLVDSNVQGQVNAYGNTVFSGTNNIKLVYTGRDSNYADPVTTTILGNFTTTNLLTGTVNSENKLYIGSADAERTTAHFGQLGGFGKIAVDNADVTYDYAFIRNNFDVTDSVLEATSINTYFAGNAVVVVDNSSWTTGAYTAVGSYGGYMYGNADLTIRNKSTLSAGRFDIENGGNYNVNVTVEDATLEGTVRITLAANTSLSLVSGAVAETSLVTNNGTISIAAAKLNADTVTNNGTITVSGESTINVGTLSGTYIRFENSTLVGESNIGGNIRTYEDFVLAGTLTVKQTNMYGTSVVKDGAVWNGSTTIVGGGSEFTLENGGTVNSRFFNVVGGTADIAGNIVLLHSDPRQKLLQIHEDGVANLNKGGVITIDGHNATINAGGTLNINGGTLNITKWNQYVNDPERGGILFNEGTLTVDASSTLIASVITGTGSITIDAAGFTGFKKIIDLSGAESLEGKVEFINKADDVRVIYGADGDISLTDADVNTLYVSADYADLEFGEAIEGEEGVYAGINAFDSLEDIADKIDTNGGDTTIKFAGNIETGNVDFKYGSGNITFAADSAVTIKQTSIADWTFVVGDVAPTITIGENVTFEVYDNASGLYVYYGAGLNVEGTVTGGANWGCTYLANGKHTVASTGTISTGRVHMAWSELAVNGTIDTNYLLVEDGVFTADNAIIDAGAIHDSNNGGLRYDASEFYINDSVLTANTVTIKHSDSVFDITGASQANVGTLTNAGTITVADSVFTAGTVVNTGAFTIAGASTVNASVTGDVLISEAGAVLSDDSCITVVGDITAAGDFSFSWNDVTADSISVKGTLSIDNVDLSRGIVYAGTITYGSLVINGSNVVENTIVVDGRMYDVTV